MPEFQYVRLDKQLRRSLAPCEMMLYAMIAGHLSNPSFSATKGGFKRHLMRHIANGGDSFNRVWRSLQQAGYLKMMRAPFGHAKFEYRYELRSAPDMKTPFVQSFTSKEGGRYFSSGKPMWTAPKKNFFAVSMSMLLDERLTWIDKWLWTIIYDQLDLLNRGLLQTKAGAPVGFLRKEDMRKASGLSHCLFEKAWARLRKMGYLHSQCFFDRQYGLTRFEYTLLPVAAAGTETETKVDRRPRRSAEEELPPVQPHSIASDRPSLPDLNRDYKAVEQVIRENIHYDVLCVAVDKPDVTGFTYSKQDLDRVVNCMVSAVCSRKSFMSINGAQVPSDVVRERILSVTPNQVLKALRGFCTARPDIRDPQAYMTTVLFNADI